LGILYSRAFSLPFFLTRLLSSPESLVTRPDDESEQDASAEEVASTDDEILAEGEPAAHAAADRDAAEEPEPEATESSSSVSSAAENESLPESIETAGDDGSEPASSDEDLPEDEELTPEIVEDEAIRGDFMIRWAVVLLALLLGIREVDQTATLVHIRVGESIRANGYWPPAQDEFSYTASERTWINLSWLSDVILSLVYAAGGAVGLSLLTGLLAATTFYLLSQISREGMPTWWGSVCGCLALLAAHLHFSALPQMVTLLGIVWVLRNLTLWNESGERKYVWCLIGSLAVWANLDSRAYLGAAVVVLYFLGGALSKLLRKSGSQDGGSEVDGAATSKGSLTDLAIAAGGSVVALMLNPFGWHSLLAPVKYYGSAVYEYELATLRYYLTAELEPAGVQLYGLLDPGVWGVLNHHIVAGLTVCVAALVVSVMTWRKADSGLLLAILAGIGVSLICLVNLPAIALVAAVAATLTGQDWYRANCRQTYSIDRLEVMFSRGGRAVTVLLLAVVAWLGVSGRLLGDGEAQIGFGFSPELQMTIDGTKEDLDAAPTGEVFTLRPDHGDLLIWHGRRAFFDSRFGLYLSPRSKLSDASNNLVLLHDQARHAIRVPTREPDPNDPRGTWHGNRALWQELFDRFGVTCVAPRMWGASPDYNTWTSLMVSPDWTLLHQGGTAALFLRTDRAGISLKRDRWNVIDLPAMVFLAEDRAPVERPPALPPNFTEKFLAAQVPLASNDLQKARHFNYYLQLATQGVPVSRIEVLSLAYLSIRHSNRALEKKTTDPRPYHELALGAAFAREVETDTLGENPPVTISHQRYVQYVHALNQTLRFSPQNADLIAQLAVEYEQAGRIDLALSMAERCVEVITSLPPAESDNEFALRQRISDSMRDLVKRYEDRRKAVEEEIVKLQKEKIDTLQISAMLRQEGFNLRALRLIEEDPALVGNIQARLIQAFLLSDAGRLEESAELFNSLGQLEADGQNPVPWMMHAAWVNMSLGDFDQAVMLLQKRISAIEEAGDRFEGFPTELPRLRWTLVRCYLESGQSSRAKEYLVELQKTPLKPVADLILREIDPAAVPTAPAVEKPETEKGSETPKPAESTDPAEEKAPPPLPTDKSND
jgi:tetratricopeptide (TPR) repeat protein